MNLIILKGRLGSDPEIKYTAGGTAYCRFSLATTEKYKEKVTTSWHKIVAWGKLAEICQKYCVKGQELMVTGKVVYNDWEKDGVKHKTTEIVISTIEFCGSKKDQKAETEDADIPF